MIHEYQTIEAPVQSNFRDRGSKFLAYGYPIGSIEDAKSRLIDLKKEHPKASHLCFAWRLEPDGSHFRVNDDGEPAGSAGRPILGQIQSKGLTNVMVVVVRYFGGTLLGIPGLIHAYKTATAIALEQAIVVHKKVESRMMVECDYTMMNEIMQLLKTFQCHIHHQELLLFCKFDIGIPLEKKEILLLKLGDIKGVTVSIKGS
ncbi:MAG: IMPACT family protein [Chitinophagaceae bacterium]